MKTYWDSSALVYALHDEAVLSEIKKADHLTRTHTIAEVFSTLTKGVSYRYSVEDAARLISDLAANLTFVELTEREALTAVKEARRLGVRGARIHDLMHATAARKCLAKILMTLDIAGFGGIAEPSLVASPVRPS